VILLGVSRVSGVDCDCDSGLGDSVRDLGGDAGGVLKGDREKTRSRSSGVSDVTNNGEEGSIGTGRRGTIMRLSSWDDSEDDDDDSIGDCERCKASRSSAIKFW
jgi:hypothetical protein